MNAMVIYHTESTYLSEKPRLGKILTRQVRDWEKPAANDCCVREKWEVRLRLASGQTLYGYVMNDPINWIDSEGTAGSSMGMRPSPISTRTPGYNRDLHEALENLNDPTSLWRPPGEPLLNCGICVSPPPVSYEEMKSGYEEGNLSCKDSSARRSNDNGQNMCECK